MGFRRSNGSLALTVDAISQRQAYNNFRKVRVLYRKIVARTPTLSGALRAGWNVSYDAPDYSFRDVRSKKEGMPVIPAPSFDLVYDRNRAWHLYIANGAPYSQRVENGWSQRAPQGMVRISVMEVFGGQGGRVSLT